MAVSISHLGYNKISQMIFEWQAADRTSLMALFIVLEVSLHWFWCLYVWWQQDALNTYVNIHYLYPLWLGISFVGLFFLCMVKGLFHSSNDNDIVLRNKTWFIIKSSIDIVFPVSCFITLEYIEFNLNYGVCFTKLSYER